MTWGTIPDWTMVAVTAAGFYLAILQLRQNLSDSRTARERLHDEEEKRREAMARAVGLKSTWQPDPDGYSPRGDGVIPVTVEVVNSGPYPIHGAILELATDDESHPMEIDYGTIFSGEHRTEHHYANRTWIHFGEIDGGATLKFTDTYSNHWSTSTSWQGLERVDEPPRRC